MNAGRPRDARVTEAILDAVLAELADKGFGGLSMDAVARRARVGKSALYRRWPSKIEMTADLMRALSVTADPAPDTGSLAGDVRALLDNVLTWLTDDRVRRVYPDLIAEAQRTPALGEALMAYVGRPRRARATEVLDRAVARGEVAVDADQEVIVDAMGALVFWRLIALGKSVTARHLDRLTVAICAMARGNASM
ncbi:TetR/AcrR family transcriptional regulator [Mycolicibacterium litorale]|uniref:TetR/AcrR family transcriptional regulator n=1 Tax=Mycolicibacterium litorale TaxID=758802 RepID=UPI003CEF314C